MAPKILVTGGQGNLAKALVALDPSIDAPPKSALDVSRYESVERYCGAARPDVIIHAAAETHHDAPPADYLQANIIGTANVALWCLRHDVRLVYLSTDYVYPGERGDYSEESVLWPINRYAESKLGGEMAAQQHDNTLIIRTSFYAAIPFAKACTDQYTSRLPVAEAAKAVHHLAVKTTLRGIINVGAKQKRSVYEIIKAEQNPSVEACTRKDFKLPYLLPGDSSLDTTKLQTVMRTDAPPSVSRTACRICGSSSLWTYLDLGVTPLANSYLREEDLPQPEFREELAIQLCETCGLSQLTKVVNPDLMFRHYLYVSSTTATFRSHCAELAESAIRRTQASRGDWALDIASNDGCLLARFQERGMNVVGVDPAENLAAEANASGIRTLCTYWSQATAKDIMSRFAPPKIITATNVIAHVDDVHEFLVGVERCLAPRGLCVIECPYVIPFIEENEFDTAYHEHLSYMSVHALQRLAQAHDMEAIDVDFFGQLHGGTIRVSLARRRDYPVAPSVGEYLAREQAFGITRRAPYEAFAQRVRRSKEDLTRVLRRLRQEGKTIWAYGASAKGNTLMNYFELSREMVPVAVDDNPKKWGWYTPGARMRIAGIDALAQARVDYLLLLAWNFRQEIMARCRAARYTNGFIVPVPHVEVIEPESSITPSTKASRP
ncbi:MAG: sugar nucleotide-binding protein [Candidatus Omnitrophica bacterium]|nr:sugar nucleotide-binding protein [Candidatus Omnitrophota bacterium]